MVSYLDYALIAGNPIRQGLPDGDEAVVVPNTYKEAMDLPQAQEWRNAVDEDIASLKQHNVHDLGPITSVPLGHKVIGSR